MVETLCVCSRIDCFSGSSDRFQKRGLDMSESQLKRTIEHGLRITVAAEPQAQANNLTRLKK